MRSNKRTPGGGEGSAEDQRLRHQAVQIVAMLPIDADDAMSILDHARDIVRFCAQRKPEPKVVIDLMRPG